MKPSSEPSNHNETTRGAEEPAADLVFPGDPGLLNIPSQLSITDMIERCQQLREWFPRGIPTAEERWAARIEAEFKLLD